MADCGHSIPDTHSLLFLVDFPALFSVHTLALPLVLLLLLEHSSKLGNQGCHALGHTPGMLVLDCLEQIRRILVTMSRGCFQIFQSRLLVSTHTVSKIVDLSKLVFPIGIAVLRRLLEI